MMYIVGVFISIFNNSWCPEVRRVPYHFQYYVSHRSLRYRLFRVDAPWYSNTLRHYGRYTKLYCLILALTVALYPYHTASTLSLKNEEKYDGYDEHESECDTTYNSVARNGVVRGYCYRVRSIWDPNNCFSLRNLLLLVLTAPPTTAPGCSVRSFFFSHLFAGTTEE